MLLCETGAYRCKNKGKSRFGEGVEVLRTGDANILLVLEPHGIHDILNDLVLI